MFIPSASNPQSHALTLTVRRAALTPLLMVCAAGCAAPGSDAEPDVPEAAQSGEQGASILAQESGSKPIAGPNDSYFAEVTAFGSGCPQGTANTRISADGQVFTTTFSAYEVKVDETSDVSSRDCRLTIRLHSPAGQSYAVHSFYYQGNAYLEDGVSGVQTAQYYFQGAPVTARSVRSNLQGVYDDDYLFQDDVQTPDEYVWSPCGVERDLEIVTRLQLNNSKPRHSGYMNLSAIDGAARLEFQLAWKPCQPSTTTPPANPPPQQNPPAQTPPQQSPQKPANDGGILGGVVGGLGGVVGGLGDTLGGVLGGLLGN